MLVFIDNLDKCSVDKSVNGLELIKDRKSIGKVIIKTKYYKEF